MLGQNELQNPTFVISKDQTGNLEPRSIFPLTENKPPLIAIFCIHLTKITYNIMCKGNQ